MKSLVHENINVWKEDAEYAGLILILCVSVELLSCIQKHTNVMSSNQIITQII